MKNGIAGMPLGLCGTAPILFDWPVSAPAVQLRLPHKLLRYRHVVWFGHLCTAS
jgi:hypothetical protein